MDPVPASSALTDACCALHPEATAAFVCSRCGAFSCEACRATPSTSLCQTCAARAEEALGAPPQVGETLSRSLRLPLEQWGAVLLYLGVTLLPVAAWALVEPWVAPGPAGPRALLTDFARERDYGAEALLRLLAELGPYLAAAGVAKTLTFVVGLLAEGALAVSFVVALVGRKTTLGSTYAATLRRFAPLLAANLLVDLAGLLGTLLCLLPGLAVMAVCMFVDPLVVVGRQGPIAAIRASVRMSLNALGPVIVLFVLTIVVVAVLGASLMPLEGLVRAYLWLAPVIAVAEEGLQALAVLPAIAGSAYLYVRLEAGARSLAAGAREDPPVAG